MTFSSFNLHPKLMAGVKAQGYQNPTPIQTKAIGPIMSGRDVMGLARTGSGKTAAFLLPIMHRLSSGRPGRVRALVVAPTRELAEQIHQECRSLGRGTPLRSMTLYGGVGIGGQIERLRKGADVVVGCPGRILDVLNRGALDVSGVETLVLDEADHMFDMGFLPDIKRILARLPKRRQTLLFSATMPADIDALAAETLNDPLKIRVDADKPTTSVRHALYPVSQQQKPAALVQLLENIGDGPILVFTRTKHRAKRLGAHLCQAGFRAASIQGNLSQTKRQAALDGFRGGRYQILVATDIAARGIDVAQVSHVINFDIPDTTDAYIHRIGRTGRAACTGEAFTFCTHDDLPMVRAIDRVMGYQVERRRVQGMDVEPTAAVKAPVDAAPRPGGRRPGPGRSPKNNRRAGRPGSTRPPRS